jgi:3-isopropylmalate/(R)-2-methylmalate dehydratase large subunit
MSRSPLAYRILSRAAGGPVRAGDRVEAALDRAVLSGVRAPSALVAVRDGGGPWSAEALIVTMDFQAPEVESQVPRSRALCRELSGTFGLRHVFDLNSGIGSQVVLESALVGPGHLVTGSGRCLGVMGSMGALGVRVDDADLAPAIVTGKVSLQVPPVIRVRVEGRLPRPAGAWDVASKVLESLGDSLRGRILEFSGDTHEWGIDLRMGLCGLLLEMGVSAALVGADSMVSRFYKERGVSVKEEEEAEDDGYETVIALEAGSVPSVVAGEYKGPHRPLREDGPRVQGVFIGSCYGGRYDDLALVSEVLKKTGRVHPDVRLMISPATLETARACLAAGFYETFLEAGAMVLVPGGGPGTSGGAIFGDGEQIASTSEYHRHLQPGQGLPEVHIVSPGSAASAAAAGALRDPSGFLA